MTSLHNSLKPDKPIFLQIKEGIENDIMLGIIKPGDQIPSTNDIASFYGINPITVMKGVSLMADEGTIFKKRGVGMFVSEGAAGILSDSYRRSFSDEHLKPLAARAKSLGITKEELGGLIAEIWEESK